MSILHTRAVSPLYPPDFVPLKRSPTFRTNQAHTSSLLSQPALSISDTELTKGVHTQTSLQNTNNMTGQTSVFSLKPTCVYVCRWEWPGWAQDTELKITFSNFKDFKECRSLVCCCVLNTGPQVLIGPRNKSPHIDPSDAMWPHPQVISDWWITMPTDYSWAELREAGLGVPRLGVPDHEEREGGRGGSSHRSNE